MNNQDVAQFILIFASLGCFANGMATQIRRAAGTSFSLHLLILVGLTLVMNFGMVMADLDADRTLAMYGLFIVMWTAGNIVGVAIRGENPFRY